MGTALLPRSVTLSRLLFACLCYGWANIATVQGVVKLQAYDTLSGTAISSPGSTEEGSIIRLKCTFPTIPTTGLYSIIFQTKNTTEEEWSNEVVCLQTNGVIAPPEAQAAASGMFNPANTTCDSNNFNARLTMVANSPKRYRCHHAHANTGIKQNSDIILRTHVKPTVPQITLPATPTEGTQVTYTCKSSARPPPKLRFSYGVAISASELSHTPALSTINDDQPAGESILRWTTNATKNMNKQLLRCSVDGLPYNSRQPIEQSQQMIVYFGPEKLVDLSEDWNLAFLKSKRLLCVFKSHGDVNYEWFNSSVSPENRLTGSQNITLDRGDFSYVTSDSPTTITYICRGTNRENNNKSALLQIILNIFITEPSTTVSMDGPTNYPQKATLEQWAIAVIAIAAVIFIVIVVLVAALVLRRRRSSPAHKKKQAASRINGSSGYINQNGDGQNPQPDIVRTNYRAPEVAVTPSSLDYRFSQNVEDYVDAIDDKPRSRRPIAYNMDELNDPYDAVPSIEGGPPGYHTHDPSMYRDYMSTPRDSYSANYGAAC